MNENMDPVVNEVRKREEETRLTRAVSGITGPVQWTNWEDSAKEKKEWRTLWFMDPARISFIYRSTFDVLPTPVNHHRWKTTTSEARPHCREK